MEGQVAEEWRAENGWRSQASWVWVLSCLFTLNRLLNQSAARFLELRSGLPIPATKACSESSVCMSVCIQPPSGGWLQERHPRSGVCFWLQCNCGTSPANHTGLPLWPGDAGASLTVRKPSGKGPALFWPVDGSENSLCHLLEEVGNSSGPYFLICKITCLGYIKPSQIFLL